ncbi:hypothetical protein CANARDRAFT_30240 [[Candida] arabinofermentans NRRL YB-2248]|uniref:Uncharacterized protein n=1 Tax=[Candida] arabinofermentans NRRL YB-2248 TaxID=983967 RepID=A0A1E4SUI2_9ASCO|nr:hypothetical protein CANARDRAFT_30240 [[Candida] arabinofermentans NRRL YB-2248]
MAIILITGANQGLGYALIKKLSKESKGNTILLGSRNKSNGEKAIESLSKEGIEASLIEIDITNDESIDKAVLEIDNKYGKLDILVNNAAISYDLSTTDFRDLFNSVLSTNVTSTFIMIKKFKPLLSKSSNAKIVNISSGLGSAQIVIDDTYGVLPESFYPYTISKAALNMGSILYSKELVKDNIKLVMIDPGYCSTNLNGYLGPKSPSDGVLAAFEAVTTDDWKTGEFLRHEPTDDKLTHNPW